MSQPIRSLSLVPLLALLATSLSAQDPQGGVTVETKAKVQTDQKPAADKVVWTGVLDEKTFASLHQLNRDKVAGLRGTMIKIGGEKAYLSLPKNGKPTGAVLVIHEWWGLNDHIKRWSDRLAADGYAALAIDLYGGVVATSRGDALAAMKAVDAEKATQTLLAGYKFLAADKRVLAKRRACIGWCFGGGWSLKLAMAAPDLDAAVIYYGHLVTDPEKLAGIKAPILGVFGDMDRGIPPLTVFKFAVAMKKAGKKLEVHRYPAEHAFANPSSARYDAKNAGKAWVKVRSFLRSKLGGKNATASSGEVTESSFMIGDRKVTFSAPSAWTKGGPRTMRALTMKFGDGAECYVVALPGEAGGSDANINRWRQQMDRDSLSEEELDNLPTIKVLGEEAILVKIDGAYAGQSGEEVDEAVLYGLVCTLPSQTVFVKMVGKASDAGKQFEAFKAFCASFR